METKAPQRTRVHPAVCSGVITGLGCTLFVVIMMLAPTRDELLVAAGAGLAFATATVAIAAPYMAMSVGELAREVRRRRRQHSPD